MITGPAQPGRERHGQASPRSSTGTHLRWTTLVWCLAQPAGRRRSAMQGRSTPEPRTENQQLGKQIHANPEPRTTTSFIHVSCYYLPDLRPTHGAQHSTMIPGWQVRGAGQAPELAEA